jgi:hypothetical protein
MLIKLDYLSRAQVILSKVSYKMTYTTQEMYLNFNLNNIFIHIQIEPLFVFERNSKLQMKYTYAIGVLE